MKNQHNTYIVYQHINKINGKRYIGITKFCDDPNKRWGNGLGYKPHNNQVSHFWNSICKYGWNNFEHSIIKERLSKTDAQMYEQYYIDMYDTRNPEKGYNKAMGGATGSSDLIWCNDGKNEFYAYKNIPNNCVRGRLLNLTEESKYKLATAKNCHWYNDGKNEFYIHFGQNIPNTYIKGRLQFSETTKKNIKNSFTQNRLENLSKLRIGVSPCNKGKHAYYSIKDGHIKYEYSCPEGYTTIPPKDLIKKRSQALIGNTHTLNMHWYHDKYTLQNKMFSSDEEIPNNYIIGKIQNCSNNRTGKHLYSNDAGEMHYYFDDESIPDGFKKGMSELQKNKYSRPGFNNSMYGKTFKWMNDGSNNYRVDLNDVQEYQNNGFKFGLLKSNNKSKGSIGMHWYTNRTINKLTYNCPNGFYRGYTKNLNKQEE